MSECESKSECESECESERESESERKSECERETVTALIPALILLFHLSCGICTYSTDARAMEPA